MCKLINLLKVNKITDIVIDSCLLNDNLINDLNKKYLINDNQLEYLSLKNNNLTSKS